MYIRIYDVVENIMIHDMLNNYHKITEMKNDNHFMHR